MRQPARVPLSNDEPAIETFRRVLADLAVTIDANVDGVIAGRDPEQLHVLRVAVRRTRTVLAIGRDVLPARVRDEARSLFDWLGGITGPARDLDVQVLGWGAQTEAVSDSALASLGVVLAEIERRRATVHDGLRSALCAPAYADGMAAWRAWLDGPAPRDGVGRKASQPTGPLIAKRIKKAHRRILDRGRRITPESPPERLHRLRKDVKRLRYLLECFGGLFDPAARKAFVRRLKDLQDHLGAHQDAQVRIDHLHELATDLHEHDAADVDVLLALGQLTEQLQQRQRAERDRFESRFSRYDTDATEQALRTLLSEARAI